jgi:nitrite reductase/ring-hydroxylating ferredoxin subunit
VTCPWHGWEYNVKTGHCANNPSSNIKVYQTIVEEGEVKIEL